MYFKLTMVFVSPFLTSIWLECADIDSKRYTSFAAIAVGAVSEHAAAPETLGHQFGVSLVVNQMAGRRNLRAGLPRGQVTARVRSSGVELQALQWQVFEMRHVWGLRICCQ